MVQWLRLQAANAGCLGSILGKRIKSHMLQLKTWCSQINSKKKKGGGVKWEFAKEENQKAFQEAGTASSKTQSCERALSGWGTLRKSVGLKGK